VNTNDPRRLFEHLRAEQRQSRERKAGIKAALSKSPIPVPDDLQDAILGLFVTDAIEVLRAHLGFEPEEKIRSLRTTFELFNRASFDLMSALDVFDLFSQRPEFSYRSHKEELTAIESRIRKEIFAFSALAHSLQDHCRRLRSDWEPPGMAEQISGCFGSDGLHDFVCGLRTGPATTNFDHWSTGCSGCRKQGASPARIAELFRGLQFAKTPPACLMSECRK
jgi:hypothetical protein